MVTVRYNSSIFLSVDAAFMCHIMYLVGGIGIGLLDMGL